MFMFWSSSLQFNTFADSTGLYIFGEVLPDTGPHYFGLWGSYKKRFGQVISRSNTLKDMISWFADTQEIFPQKMLILTILSQRIGILDNFPLLKVKNMGKLSGSVGNFERKLGSYKDLKAKYTATPVLIPNLLTNTEITESSIRIRIKFINRGNTSLK